MIDKHSREILAEAGDYTLAYVPKYRYFILNPEGRHMAVIMPEIHSPYGMGLDHNIRCVVQTQVRAYFK